MKRYLVRKVNKLTNTITNVKKLTSIIRSVINSDPISKKIKTLCGDQGDGNFVSMMFTKPSGQTWGLGALLLIPSANIHYNHSNNLSSTTILIFTITSGVILVNYLVGKWEDRDYSPKSLRSPREKENVVVDVAPIKKPEPNIKNNVKVIEKKELSIYEKGLSLTKALSEYKYGAGGGKICVAVVGYNDEAPMVTVYKIIPVLDRYVFDETGSYVGIDVEQHIKKGGKVGALLKKGANLNILEDLGDNLSRDLGLPKGQNISVDVNIGDGKGAIYLPKEKRDWVYLDDYLDVVEESKALLPMFLGKTLEGESLVVDMVDARHSAIVGTNKSGKTVGIIAQLLGLAYARSPDVVEFILVDPKFVGLNVLKNLPHVKGAVITDLELALYELESIESEMDNRYIKLQKMDVQDIVEYNNVSNDKMAFKVVAIDEFLDMLEDDTVIETKEGKTTTIAKRSRRVLGKLFKKGRGAGIHVNVLAQRFAAEDVPGSIRNNAGLRVCMSVTDSHASTMVLGKGEDGGAALLSFGDTLTKLQDWNAPVRSQGAGFKNDSEDMKRIVEMIKEKWLSSSEEKEGEELIELSSLGSGG